MFRKILIANRGEIAVRVMRTCRELGISTVGVYSEADRKSLHVRYADEAYCIGPAPSTESYLHIERILAAAQRSGVDAIHPGYGFLAENPEFARACADAGVVFIGPPVAAMELMGSKTSARHALIQAGLPVVPGTDRHLESLEETYRVAEGIGYPVMLKASAGGGGKGLRLVRSAAELESAYHTARSEAQNAFGDPAVYLEKYLERPRHIEIQILGDRHGNLIHLGERECSLQRRHQKLLEECPSAFVDEELRRRMGETAVRIGKLAGYWNAGTVEFLVDQGRNFYFLEVNARLQVEHPVTELVLGIDLVKEQIRIAAGERLEWRQEDVRLRGAAIECRVYAEDPSNNFFPSPGYISRLQVPAGPGVRRDSGVYEGWTVPLEYDPLLSKVSVWGTARAEAMARMRRALGEYEVFGIKTNIPFFRRLLEHPDFAAGRLDTGFIDRVLAAGLMEEEPPSPEEERVAALAAALHVRGRQEHRIPAPAAASAWKRAGRDAALNRWPRREGWKRMKLAIRIQSGSKTSDHEFELTETVQGASAPTARPSSTSTISFDGETLLADREEIAPGVYSILIDGRSYEAQVSKRAGDSEGASSPYVVTVGLRNYLVEIRDPRRWKREGSGVREHGPREIVAPMPGKIVRVLVSENQEVMGGQGLLVIEAMKMQNEIRAPRAGRVERIYAREGTGVEAGFRLIRIA